MGYCLFHIVSILIIMSASIEDVWSQAENAILTKSVLSDKAILAHLQLGTVVIEPFTLSNRLLLLMMSLWVVTILESQISNAVNLYTIRIVKST